MSKRAEEFASEAYPLEVFKGSMCDRFRSLIALGYEQAEKDTIERAAEWLSSIDNGTKIVDVKAFVNAFRNEMEEDI